MDTLTISAKPVAQRLVEQVQAFYQPYVTVETRHSFKESSGYSKAEWLQNTLEETQLKHRMWSDLYSIFGFNFLKRRSDATASYIKHLTYQIQLLQQNS